jgi:hypothetical protein
MGNWQYEQGLSWRISTLPLGIMGRKGLCFVSTPMGIAACSR